MSEIVGREGRVFAFEPVPQTFAVLVRLLAIADRKNVTALNLACSNTNDVVSISVPDDPVTGENLYRATIMRGGPSPVSICCVRLDDLALPLDRLRLVKIDAETHETEVIEGMWQLISEKRPVLIIEHLPAAATARLLALGYTRRHRDRSPNSVFIPDDVAAASFD
jgi:FkbM family methyltransferase